MTFNHEVSWAMGWHLPIFLSMPFAYGYACKQLKSAQTEVFVELGFDRDRAEEMADELDGDSDGDGD